MLLEAAKRYSSLKNVGGNFFLILTLKAKTFYKNQAQNAVYWNSSEITYTFSSYGGFFMKMYACVLYDKNFKN